MRKGRVITDVNTQLEWQNNFTDKILELSWDKAVAYCENLSLDGKKWKLPNKKKLVSIIKKDNSKPALDSVF